MKLKKPTTDEYLPPLARNPTYTPRADRSGVERKSDEALGLDTELEAEREVAEAREEDRKRSSSTSGPSRT